MVDLVLQAGRKEPARLQLLLAALEVEILARPLRGPPDLLIEFRDRKATFLVDRLLIRSPKDLGIDEDARRLLFLLLGEIHGHNPPWHADLNGGEPDTGRLV